MMRNQRRNNSHSSGHYARSDSGCSGSVCSSSSNCRSSGSKHRLMTMGMRRGLTNTVGVALHRTGPMVKVEASEDIGGMADIAQVRVVHVIESTVRCNCGQLLGPMAPGTGMHVGSLAPPTKFESNSDCGAALTYVSVCIGISSQCACTASLWLAPPVAMVNAAAGRHVSDDDCSAFSGTNFSWPSGQTVNLPFGSGYQQ